MKKLLILITIISVILIAIILIFTLNPRLTGQIVKEENYYSTHTKALCNETNFCQDYVIECQGNKTISTTPITGATIQHSKDWQDPRGEDSLKLCR